MSCQEHTSSGIFNSVPSLITLFGEKIVYKIQTSDLHLIAAWGSADNNADTKPEKSVNKYITSLDFYLSVSICLITASLPGTTGLNVQKQKYSFRSAYSSPEGRRLDFKKRNYLPEDLTACPWTMSCSDNRESAAPHPQTRPYLESHKPK